MKICEMNYQYHSNAAAGSGSGSPANVHSVEKSRGISTEGESSVGTPGGYSDIGLPIVFQSSLMVDIT